MPGARPTMFIGSSVEGRRIAEALQLNLQYDLDCTVWHQGVFALSRGTLESLVRVAAAFDFAALVLTPDDLLLKRGRQVHTGRDNVVFELGLFMGALGPDRTFVVHGRDERIELPTDLAGVTAATFAERDDLTAALGPVATQIRQHIDRLQQRLGGDVRRRPPEPPLPALPPILRGADPLRGPPGGSRRRKPRRRRRGTTAPRKSPGARSRRSRSQR